MASDEIGIWQEWQTTDLSNPDKFQDTFTVQAVLKLSGRQNSIKSFRADSHVRR